MYNYTSMIFIILSLLLLYLIYEWYIYSYGIKDLFIIKELNYPILVTYVNVANTQLLHIYRGSDEPIICNTSILNYMYLRLYSHVTFNDNLIYDTFRDLYADNFMNNVTCYRVYHTYLTIFRQIKDHYYLN